MALFYQSYLYIPQSDRKKTTLMKGNPHRLDHFMLGAVICQASLYKPPKSPTYESYWLWDDPDFDPYDIQPSEFLLTKQIFDRINREMERVQNDQNVNFRDHFIVGTDLNSQLNFLHQRACHLQIHSSEIIYYTLLGGIPIDLGTLASGKNTPAKHLKPHHVPKEIQSLQSHSLLTSKEVFSSYEDFNFSLIEERSILDIKNMISYYHFLRSS